MSVFFTATTHDQYAFSFYPNHRSCNGFEEALARYRNIVPNLNLSGSFTSFPLLLIYIFLLPTANEVWFLCIFSL
jgi:E3 ubiquitin-protein ligase RGLG